MHTKSVERQIFGIFACLRFDTYMDIGYGHNGHMAAVSDKVFGMVCLVQCYRRFCTGNVELQAHFRATNNEIPSE